jgi:hypothetical protein
VVVLKRDACVEKPKWLYEKRTKVWLGSGVKVVGAARAAVDTTSASPRLERATDIDRIGELLLGV